MWSFLDDKVKLPPVTDLQVLLTVISQVVSFSAFATIVFTLVYLVRKKNRQIPYAFTGYYLATFLGLDACTHVIGALTYFYPLQWLYVSTLCASALVALVTALLFIPFVPKVLALPSPIEYEMLMEDKRQAEAALQANRAALEQQTLQRNLLEQEASYLREQDVRRARDRDQSRIAQDRMDAILSRLEGTVKASYPEMLSDAV